MDLARCQGVRRHNTTVINALLGASTSAHTCRQLSRHALQRSPYHPASHDGACLRQRRCRPQRTAIVLAAAAGYQPYGFDEGSFYRCHFRQMIIHTAADAMTPTHGSVLLMRQTAEGRLEDQGRALIVQVGGDTMTGLAMLLDGSAPTRPSSLDLLWTILQRGQEVSEAGGSRSKWRVVRVAIVALQDMVYIGRLFFGDADTGDVVWDCDVRPSDGCWLAMKAHAPIYISKHVWEACSSEVTQQAGPGATVWPGAAAVAVSTPGGTRHSSAQRPEELDPLHLLTTLMPGDAEPIKRLKREMSVALSEEDYATAARIRDHPYIQLYLSINEALRKKDVEAARELSAELTKVMNAGNEAAEQHGAEK